ncbi:MAG: hypothetical protein WCE69_05740 [Aestuariivirga sp.]
MLKALFKKNQPTPEQIQALQEANMALRVRMERLLREGAAEHFGQARETGKSIRRVFEGQVAA